MQINKQIEDTHIKPKKNIMAKSEIQVALEYMSIAIPSSKERGQSWCHWVGGIESKGKLWTDRLRSEPGREQNSLLTTTE